MAQMNKINYQKQLDGLIAEIEKRIGEGGAVPTLFLHSCCAPCSSYTLEYLSQYFRITIFYYNPNIMRKEEYEKRVAEQQRLISELNEKEETRYKISFVEGSHDPKEFVQAVKGLEHEPEGGARCRVCYKMRLDETARLAADGGYDFFCTTLSISPLKHADWLNELGEIAATEKAVRWLVSDFKKKGGYKRSIELSKEHNLYRQNFCGCEYSRINKTE